MKIAKEINPNSGNSHYLPNGVYPLYALASVLANQDETTKEQILDQVQQATEEKGKPLTEKEIKELLNIPLLVQYS